MIRLVFRSVVCAMVVGLGGTVAQAQPVDSLRGYNYGTGGGLTVLVTNNGFGLGGYYSRAVNDATSLWVEASLGSGKDAQELKLFNRFGGGFVQFKRNYFLMLPIAVGAQRRLFRESIEDNFRPYVQISGGPTLGWEYPYFEDANGNERFDEFTERRYGVFTALPKGDMRFGLGGTLALGAYFGLSRRVTQGIRFGYSFTYFFEGVQLLEPSIKGPQQFFGTPAISLTFGRLF